MRKLLLTSVAGSALLAGTALGADLPVRTLAPAPAPVAYAPAFTWAGVYAGVNIGGARRDNRLRIGEGNYDGPFSRPDDFEADPGAFGECDEDATEEIGGCPITFLDGISGGGSRGNRGWSFTGGAQVGVNGQWGGLVAGLEADFNWVGGGRGGHGSFDTGGFFFGETRDDFTLDFSECEDGDECVLYNGNVNVRAGRSNWLSTVRGRLGFAFDRFLVYGTGGVAFQGAGNTRAVTTLTRTDTETGDCNVDVCTFQNTARYTVTSNRNQVGWAAGVGVEWAFLNNTSLGLEYLHADFGSYDVAFIDPVLTAAGDQRQQVAGGDAGPAGVQRHVRVRDSIDLVRLKLNVRF